MLEDIRDHDPAPTEEELAWMATEAVTILARAVILAGVALAVGFAASMAYEVMELPPSVAVVSPQ